MAVIKVGQARDEKQEAIDQLNDIDRRSIRSIREFLASNGHVKSQQLETEAESARVQLRGN